MNKLQLDIIKFRVKNVVEEFVDQRKMFTSAKVTEKIIEEATEFKFGFSFNHLDIDNLVEDIFLNGSSPALNNLCEYNTELNYNRLYINDNWIYYHWDEDVSNYKGFIDASKLFFEPKEEDVELEEGADKNSLYAPKEQLSVLHHDTENLDISTFMFLGENSLPLSGEQICIPASRAQDCCPVAINPLMAACLTRQDYIDILQEAPNKEACSCLDNNCSDDCCLVDCCGCCCKPPDEVIVEPITEESKSPFPGVATIEHELNEIKISDFKTDDVYEMSINLIENVMNLSYILGEHVWNRLTNVLERLNK